MMWARIRRRYRRVRTVEQLLDAATRPEIFWW